MGLDEYIKYVNEHEGTLGYDSAFYINLADITRIIRLSVFHAYNDVLKYGSQENKDHAAAVMNLISRYRSGQTERVMTGGSASKAREQISILVQTFRQ